MLGKFKFRIVYIGNELLRVEALFDDDFLVFVVLLHFLAVLVLFRHRHFHFFGRSVGVSLDLVRDESPLIDRGKKTVGPERRANGSRNIGAKHDITRQVLIVRTEAISHPGTERRPTGLVRAGVHHETGWFVIRNFCMDGTDPADVVGDAAKAGPDLADVHAALAIFLESERRSHQLAGLALRFDFSPRHGLAVIFLQSRLGVETVDGGETTVHEKKDYPLYTLGMIQLIADTTIRGS